MQPRSDLGIDVGDDDGDLVKNTQPRSDLGNDDGDLSVELSVDPKMELSAGLEHGMGLGVTLGAELGVELSVELSLENDGDGDGDLVKIGNHNKQFSVKFFTSRIYHFQRRFGGEGRAKATTVSS